ncbi:MAG: peptidoglycan editing factor PgeF [Candidatus Sedimenticola endophacoides]
MPPVADWITPDWPAPAGVRALITTRNGGVGAAPYDTLNLGGRVGDDPCSVQANRALLGRRLGLPSQPLWLNQVHGRAVARCGSERPGVTADAVVADRPGAVCAVLTADCLPLLICDRGGREVAAVHAGWRGLAAGVIEAALARLSAPGPRLMAWLGPAIGPRAFEVGPEVRAAFMEQDARCASAFAAHGGRWLADIYQLARLRLRHHGVGYIGGGEYCTVSDGRRFFSYRRDGVTGRMASLIWIDAAGE